MTYAYFTASQLTVSEFLGLLADDPMPAIDICDFESREESPNDGQCFVGHIMALCASDEQGRTLPSRLFWVGEGKVGHVVESVR